MPRALCINAIFVQPAGLAIPPSVRPVEQMDYIVLDEIEVDGKEYYRFYEFGPLWYYTKDNFILLDGPSTTAKGMGWPHSDDKIKNIIWTEEESGWRIDEEWEKIDKRMWERLEKELPYPIKMWSFGCMPGKIYYR